MGCGRLCMTIPTHLLAGTMLAWKVRGAKISWLASEKPPSASTACAALVGCRTGDGLVARGSCMPVCACGRMVCRHDAKVLAAQRASVLSKPVDETPCGPEDTVRVC